MIAIVLLELKLKRRIPWFSQSTYVEDVNWLAMMMMTTMSVTAANEYQREEEEEEVLSSSLEDGRTEKNQKINWYAEFR